MRVVLISYHFPPDTAVGGLRAAKVAEAFRKAGHEVHVIAGIVPGAEMQRQVLPSGIVIERVTSWRNPREVWLSLKARRQRATGSTTEPAAEESAGRPAHVAGWKRQIFALLWLPDDRQGFVPPAIRAARRAFPGGPDLVYTSAPPFSAHLAGLWLSARGVRWVAEFRDPWTDNAWKPAHVRSAWSDAVERWLEHRTLARAERIIAVSQGIARIMAAKLPEADRGRVILVRNGIEWLAAARPTPTGAAPRRIVYVGTFYFGRDPRLFLEGLAEVVRRRRLSAEEIQVDLVGQCRWFNGISIEGEVARLGLKPFVDFRDWVPHEACQRILRQADVLLLLAQAQPDQVPNKLYEYLGTRAPILAFSDTIGETTTMLEETGGHTVVSGDQVTDAVRGIEQVLGLSGEVRRAPDESRLRTWTTEGQMAKLLTAIGA